MKKAVVQEVIKNPREFVKHWFKLNGYVMKSNGEFSGDSPVILHTLSLDYAEMYAAACAKAEFDAKTGKRMKIHRISQIMLEAAWGEFLENEKLVVRQKLIDSIKFTNEGDELSTWLRCVMGNYEPVHLAAMQHFLWQIKRKANNSEVVHQLVPCFWGSQGSGKSTAIEMLLSPIRELKLEWSPDQAIDSRNTAALKDNLVCVFDEMAGLQRVEIEALKRIITNSHITYRPLFTNRYITSKQNCTFIGISNKALAENISDATGMRRFVEYACLPLCDWKSVNGIDMLRIWQSIDESKCRGYIEPFMETLKLHQATSVVLDALGDFVKTNELVPHSGLAVVEIPTLELWKKFDAWRLENGYGGERALSANWFYRRLRSYGLANRRVKVNGKDVNMYSVNAESLIFAGQAKLSMIKSENE